MTRPEDAPGETPSLVLVVNCGSSSVKLALIDPGTGQRRVSALGERVGTKDVVVHVSRGSDTHEGAPADNSYHAVIEHMLGALSDDERAAVCGVGHRVVHGGTRFSASVLVDDAVLTALRELAPLAPLHMPASFEGIEAARMVLPHLPQVAFFDTAFHQTMPPFAYRYAVPSAWYTEHDVRRYGFHGASHRYVSARAAELLDRPLESTQMITLHLGNGCSATAVRNGVSVDTTMGLTPAEGLVMGTRSGDIDPGLFGYIAERLGLDVFGVLDVLNESSGLLGLSGLSNDMRTLSDAANAGAQAAALAVDVFCYRASKAVGALSAALDRVDSVVFTGGIGERGTAVRSAILARLAVFGMYEDAVANGDHGRSSGGRVSTADSVPVLVVPTDEELVIALDTLELSR